MDKTLANAKHLNAVKGYHWFDPNSLRFWGTKFHSPILKEKYFITSEDSYDRTTCLFSVRLINWETGDVNTVGEFQGFKTKQEAKQYIEKECE